MSGEQKPEPPRKKANRGKRDLPRYRPVDLGQLPVEAINRALGTELEPGPVRLSAMAHQHMAEDHADDYVACFAAFPTAVATPTFIGQAPKHTRNFEVIRRVLRANRRSVLVAVGLEPNNHGAYRVRFCDLTSAEDVDDRRRARRLVQIAF